jgi:hypothetical protein
MPSMHAIDADPKPLTAFEDVRLRIVLDDLLLSDRLPLSCAWFDAAKASNSSV